MEKWFKGFHHYYLGLALLITGFVLMGFAWYCTGVIIIVFGVIVIIDDAWQHFRHRTHPEYQSPLHRLYGTIYSNFAFIRRLNKLADRMLGG